MSKSEISATSDVNEALPTPAKQTLWNRFKSHMKRFWWAYLLALCVIVLVTVLPILYVGVPHFAENYINNSAYGYDGLEITNPRPTAFHVKQRKSLPTGGAVSGSGHLDAFNATCRVEETNQAFGSLSVPQISFGNGAYLDISQDVELSCVDCMSKIATNAASNKSSSLLLEGASDLHLGGIPTAHVNIQKTMHVGSYNVTEYLNADGGFNISSIELLDPPVDGYNLNATIAVRNPGVFSVELGRASFNLTLGDKDLGYVVLPHLFLEQEPRDSVVLGSIDKAMLIHEAITGDDDFGTVTIGIHGHNCSYNGVDIPYFTAAIKAISAPSKIDLLKYASKLFS
ncbi:hypothetical protein N7452_010242 [Penicillium brevicompactum]|uniref:Uncharacterized protein n=1 Tax=Penicillium brevicompactum TaxID=5074 RepID=A0A9W9UAW0_PENBR|nr:hypothetical protein N7452_010242 [Penicillium brevicompactum]